LRKESGERIEVALQWSESTEEHVKSFVNGIPAGDGGTHETGFRAELSDAVRDYINTQELTPRGVKIANEDIRTKAADAGSCLKFHSASLLMAGGLFQPITSSTMTLHRVVLSITGGTAWSRLGNPFRSQTDRETAGQASPCNVGRKGTQAPLKFPRESLPALERRPRIAGSTQRKQLSEAIELTKAMQA